MTDKQAEEISKYLETVNDDIIDTMFHELTAGVNTYFAVLLFGEDIEKVFNDPKNKTKSTEEIAKIVKEVTITKKEILNSIDTFFNYEQELVLFAEDCVESDVFNPAYPPEILKKIEELEINVKDFSAELILSFSNDIVDFFTNDIEEWRNDVIDVIISLW